MPGLVRVTGIVAIAGGVVLWDLGVGVLEAARGALPRDRRRTSQHGEQGRCLGNAPNPHRTYRRKNLETSHAARERARTGVIPGSYGSLARGSS